MAPRHNYREGHWFLIPVPDEYLEDAPDHRFGAGLVARGKRGRVVFAYIFGPWPSQPLPEELAGLQPGGELMTLLTPDGGLRSGRFPLLAVQDGFSRDRWPMPEFSMYMGGDNPAWAMRTSDDKPFEAIDKRVISPAEARALPQWAESGYANVFRKLADPGARLFRIADHYGKPRSRPTSLRNQQIEVHFVVPHGAEQRLLEELREALEVRGWEASVSTPDEGAPGPCWVIGTRPYRSLSEVEVVDRDMRAVAGALPGVEYDGHGITLSSE